MSSQIEKIHPLADLGPLRVEDYKIFYDLFTHKQLVPYLPEQAIPKNHEEAKKEIQFLMKKEWQGIGKYWGIYHDDKLIGTVGLHTLLAHEKTIEISYELHPDYWGQGIATCATLYCVEFARLHMLNINKVLAYTLVDNIGSHRVALKSGFISAGILRNDCFYHGKLIDRHLFELVLRDNE